MITNERQYRITKAELQRLQTSLKELQTNDSDEERELNVLHRKALTSQVEEFTQAVSEYEELLQKKARVLEATSLLELPLALIRARIARGFNQKDFADKLGVKEQQVQRWEASNYESASLANLARVVEALGVQVREEIFVPEGEVSAKKLVDRLKDFGLPQRLLIDRLLPPDFIAAFSNRKSTVSEGTVFQVATKIGRIFNLSLRQLLADEAGSFDFNPVGAARFKVPANARQDTLNVYTLYAHYLAVLTAQISSNLPKTKLPADWNDARAAILKKYDRVDFKSVLNYAWDCGVPVLPLDDPGAFHGAVWRINGRNIIVLKQRKPFASIWLHDLLHEMFHAGEESGEKNFSHIEATPISPERRESSSEESANGFAEDVVFGNRSDEIEDVCFAEAGTLVPRLKTAIPRVAERFQVDQGYLANYIAYVLEHFKGINFWGTATNLQEDSYAPFEYAREVFFQRVSMGQLNAADREILMQGLRGGIENNA